MFSACPPPSFLSTVLQFFSSLVPARARRGSCASPYTACHSLSIRSPFSEKALSPFPDVAIPKEENSEQQTHDSDESLSQHGLRQKRMVTGRKIVWHMFSCLSAPVSRSKKGFEEAAREMMQNQWHVCAVLQSEKAYQAERR